MDGESATCGVDGVNITGDLDRRPSRAPDYEAESRALTALARTMSVNPAAVLQHLVETAMDLTRSGSAGISLLEPGGEQGTFRWAATTGAWAPYRDGTMPREQSPCGEVIAREAVLLLDHPERAFPALLQAQPAIGEGLLAPFAIDGAPGGTVWVIKHRSEDHFDAEDARLLKNLAQLASAAHQMAIALRDAEARRLTSETRLRALAYASSDAFYIMSADMSELRELSGGDFLNDTTKPSRAWLRDYVPVEDRARAVAAVAEAVRTKGVFQLEHRVHQTDGSVGWALSRAVPILDAHGNVVEWFGAATDISGRKGGEDALRRGGERQAFLLKLNDALRAQPNDDAVVDLATRMLAQEMELDRCYAAVIYTAEDRVDIVREFRRPDLAPMPSQLRYSDYPEGAKQSFVQTLVFDDTAIDPALTDLDRRSLAAMNFGALISPPLRHGAGKPIWAMGAVNTQPRHWTPGEVALVEDVAERTWAAVERARAEAALRESEERLRTLFDSIDEGFVEFEVYMSADGRALDWKYLKCNPAFERLSGLPDMTGRLASEFLPNLEQEWAERFAQVVTTGEAARFDLPAAQLDRWFEVYVVRPGGPGSRRLMVVYNNVIERKRAEQALRESEERQTFLLKLSDVLRPLADPIDVQAEAMRVLAEHLGVPRAQFWRAEPDGEHFVCERDYSPGLPATPTRLRLSDFGAFAHATFDKGETLVIADAASDPRITAAECVSYEQMGFRACLGVPLVKAGRLVVTLGVYAAEPHAWTPQEIALTNETAERTWAEVERACAEAKLRDSEARLTAAFESVPVGAAVIDLSGTAVTSNANFRRFLPTGVVPSHDPVRGTRWRGWNSLGSPLTPQDFPAARAMRGERVVPGQEMLYADDDGREIWTNVATVPIRDDRGRVTGLVTAIADIDAAKRAEQAVADSEARFRQFSDASTNILWIRDAKTLRMIFASPAFDAIYGIPGPERGGDAGLLAWVRLIAPGNRKNVLANFRRVRSGERIEMEFQVRRAPDGALRWIHNTDFPLRDAAGEVRWVAGLGADITDAKEATDRQGVLVAELQHRTRNLIAVVRSLSDRTLGNAASLDDFGKRFRLRLAALSRVQGLLSHLAAGERVTFDELLRSELTAHGALDGSASKVTLDGPAGVPLRSGTVQTFALALHELATNAVKYGALAASNGHLTVRWHVETPGAIDPPRLHVEWQESGVIMPQVNEPLRGGGYGRELIERALPYQLKAKTSYELGADGVRCTIAVPISRAASEGVADYE